MDALPNKLSQFLQAISGSWKTITAILVVVALITLLLPLPDNDTWLGATRNALLVLALTGFSLHYLHVRLQLKIQQQVVHNAQLDSLQAHIRPHFLFNSMNIIASLIQVDPEKAEQAVEDLSDLFRSSLQDKNVITSIEQEIHLSKSYLRIEQNRLGERLQTLWHISTSHKGLTIPAFTIQPLVENAVYHGIQPLEQGGLVQISVSVHENKVQILVENPMPLTGTISKGNQIALTNIRSRLIMLYGKEADLITEIQEDDDTRKFIARVVYPLSHE
ncbi:hypothetical protein ACH42_11560 [Endozoicomonas sp. (ex Bugula neritina AB1)]|nr:hypothetical protein ACH42_11560 [Endozoicomonas sp. (ex Bugula neritina AB1)]